MRFLNLILLSVALGCGNDSIKQKVSRNIFLHEGDFQKVEFPIPEGFRFVESTIYLIDPPGWVSYTDSLHDQRIQISPAGKAEFLYNRYDWQTKSETELIEDSERVYEVMQDLKAFYLPIKSFYGKDSSSFISLTYYPFWKIDSTEIKKYVVFRKLVQNADGWCDVSVRKEYIKLDIIEDYKWADSLDKMTIIIKKPTEK